MLKRTLPLIALALLGCLLLAGCGSGQAQPKASVSDAKLDPVLASGYRQIAAFTSSDLATRTAAEQKRLAPCVNKLAAAAQAHQAAGLMLSKELDLQYTVAVAQPVYQAVEGMDRQLAALPWGAATRGQFRSAAQNTSQALSLDTCADLAAWQAKGFAEKALPAGVGFVSRLEQGDTPPLVPSVTVKDANASLKAAVAQGERTLTSTEKSSQASFTAWIKKIA